MMRRAGAAVVYVNKGLQGVLQTSSNFVTAGSTAGILLPAAAAASANPEAATLTAAAAAASWVPPQLQRQQQSQRATTSSSCSSNNSSLYQSSWPPLEWHQQQQRQRQQQHHHHQQQWQLLCSRRMSSAAVFPDRHSTTILCVRKGPEVVIMGDGQATQGDFVVKPNVKKVRRIGSSAVGGFAGVAVDGLSLLERLEAKLEEHPGQLQRAAVELAKMWRQDKLLRELDASLIVADATGTFLLMGNGDVLETEADGVIGIGSGADFAESAARALLQLQRDLHQQHGRSEADGSVETTGGQQHNRSSSSNTTPEEGTTAVCSHSGDIGSSGVPAELQPVMDMSLFEVAKAAMTIAANSCIYTNDSFSWQHIKLDGSIDSGDSNSSNNSTVVSSDSSSSSSSTRATSSNSSK